MDDLERIYASRFADREAAAKDRVWKEIGRHLQRYIPRGSRVLDLACDRGHFIGHIEAGEKWATDQRDVRESLAPDVRFEQSDGRELASRLPNDYFDVIFMSNYLEHLPDSDAVIQQLQVCHRLLRADGRVMILQPNIRLVGPKYWDFIDHHLPLTEKSLVEAAHITGFKKLHLLVHYLPYTTKGRLPQHPLLVRGYLAFPPIWRLMGRQTLYVGVKS